MKTKFTQIMIALNFNDFSGKQNAVQMLDIEIERTIDFEFKWISLVFNKTLKHTNNCNEKKKTTK